MRLGQARVAFAIVSAMLSGYATAGQTSDSGAGAQRFMEYCAGCHGADGKGGDKAPSLIGPSNRANHSESELSRIVHEGTKGGMPPFAQIGDANIAAVVRYIRRLAGSGASTGATTEAAVTGDVDAGRTLYFGKAQCANCHLMRGKGGFIATNLTNYGRARAASVILEAITNPDNPLVPSSQVVTVRTAAGKTMTGVLRNEDAFSLAVQTEDGRFHLLARSEVTDVKYSGRSLMPRDYNARLSSKELNDIVSFLIVESRNSHSADANAR